MELLRAGRSLLLRGPNDTKPHLWFVLTDPAGTPPRVVAVMLRTAKEYTDPTVVLVEGDHPFVQHDSSVHYSSAAIFPVSGLKRAIRLGTCHLRDDMGPGLLRRVQAGLLESPFTVLQVKEYCRTRF